MIDDSTVIDPMEMQPFRHARVGIPANTILVRYLHNARNERVVGVPLRKEGTPQEGSSQTTVEPIVHILSFLTLSKKISSD